MPQSAPSTGERVSLSYERIIDAGLAFIDEHGVEALSMRKLAAELGVEAMSLYNHVKNKDDLLDGIADRIWEMVELQPYTPRSDWKAWIVQAAIDARNVVAAHPNAIPLAFERAGHGTGLLHLIDRFIEVLADAGFEGEDVHHAWRLLEAPFIGYMNQLANRPDWPSNEERELYLLQLRYRASQAGLTHYERYFEDFTCCNWADEMTWGMEVILDGLERRLQGR